MTPSLYDMPTYLDAALAAGHACAPVYSCPCCKDQQPPEGLVDTTGLPGCDHRFICHKCASHAHRLKVASEQPATDPWDGVRARRTALLAWSDWTQTLDAPLPTETVVAWAAWRQALRDLTTTYETPEAVIWPPNPNEE